MGRSQVGSIGRTTRQDVEAGQQEEGNSGKIKVSLQFMTQPQRKQDENASLIKAPSHVANVDKDYGLI